MAGPGPREERWAISRDTRDGATSAPLDGLAVIVTRPGAGDEPLSRALHALGAEVRALPSVVIEPPSDPRPLERALEQWSAYDWVAFTSPRGVSAVAQALADRGREPPRHAPRRLAAVGPTTAAAARSFGWSVDVVPERFDAEGLLGALDRCGVPLAGARVLLPLAEDARETLGAGLRARSARVDQVVAYRSVAPPTAGTPSDLLGGERPILVTLASPSAARNLLELAGEGVLGLPTAAIGPVTARAARGLGYDVVVQPEEHTLEALTRAIAAWWGGRAR